MISRNNAFPRVSTVAAGSRWDCADRAFKVLFLVERSRQRAALVREKGILAWKKLEFKPDASAF